MLKCFILKIPKVFVNFTVLCVTYQIEGIFELKSSLYLEKKQKWQSSDRLVKTFFKRNPDTVENKIWKGMKK